MSRLIDANANREKFKEVVYRTLNDCNITTKKKFNLIMTAFDNMPTAYDAEKVVAMMDEALVEFKDGTNCTECVFKDVCDDGYEGCTDTMVAVCKGVVRKGGVE